jgi:hypothetical protein
MTDNQLMDLYRKVSLLGLGDLSRLAPIGDIGDLNGIEFYRHWSSYGGFRKFLRTDLLEWVYKAYCEQFKRMGWTEQHSQSGRCINDYYCPELGFRYGIDSSD